VTQSRTINQTLQTINNNNNNNFSTTIAKNKIHMNVDQSSPQINSSNNSSNNHTEFKEVDHQDSLNEPNNNTSKEICNNTSTTTKNSSSTSSSSSKSCYRNHPVSRNGTEFISPQVPGFRSYGGNNKYITQKNR
jgi:hypothetical protein